MLFPAVTSLVAVGLLTLSSSQLHAQTSSISESLLDTSGASSAETSVASSYATSFASNEEATQSGTAEGLDIVSFDAVYDMYRQGDLLGSGKRALTKLDNDKYQLTLESELEWLIFSDNRKEVSTFLMSNAAITPLEYTYERSGTGSDKSLTIAFEPDNKLTITPRPKKNAAPEQREPHWLDEMSMHMQIQLDLINGKSELNYTIVSNKGELKEYQFEVIGEELISTGMGRFKAVKVARVYENRKFYAQHAWFIPELNYTLARLWRMKKGVEQYDLVIKSYTSSKI